ncbi:SseB family protein [Curtobacterium sp. ISL-83]|uniref:SseB family protein n=1 Tax=Curtobacterium sp. ISL-83 TaxID=2819145 RepID=UPI001BED352F|nr:SseB family protein [Curtobacterium sp. ISL-83]MBT2501882.1 SseB family protein [Curtobacterium sp. ISL-83]
MSSANRRAFMVRSRFAFAAAEVIALRQDEHGTPLGIVSDDQTPFAMAFTNPEAARARVPEGVRATPLSLPMHRLARLVPETWGIVLDVDDPYPQVVAPAQKADVVAASGPFPVGADVSLDAVQRADHTFTESLREQTAGAAGISRVWVFRHRVDILPDDLMVVVASDGPESSLRYADAVFSVAERLQMDLPVTTAWIDELPVDHAMWIRQQPTVLAPGAE